MLFACLVLLFHSYELIDGTREREPLTSLAHTISLGDLAVDFFFALSGFLVTQSWERKPKIKAYLKKRVGRIYPGFIVAFLLSMALVGPIAATSAASYWADLKPSHLAIGLVLLWQPATPPVFGGSHYPEINAPLWTISYEFLCYLALMLLGVSGLLRRRSVIVLLWLGIMAVFIILRSGQLETHPTGTITGHLGSAVRFGMLFLAGVTFSKYRFHHWRHPFPVALAVLLVGFGLTSPVLAEPALATFGTYLILVVGFTPFAAPSIGRMPDFSYGTYLYGWPVQKMMILFFPAMVPTTLFLFSVPAAIACGALSWLAVERPFLERVTGQRRRLGRARADRILSRSLTPSSAPASIPQITLHQST